MNMRIILINLYNFASWIKNYDLTAIQVRNYKDILMTKVAIIGSQGVPAHYGGFETLVENLLGENCPCDIEYTVFCSSSDMQETTLSYKRAALRYIHIHANGTYSMCYDILSMCRCLTGYDAILILGVSGCMFLPLMKRLTKSKIIINIDGVEHRRRKWGKFARWILRKSEALAVKHADVIVADNRYIQDYVVDTYGRSSELIAYGGDHAIRNISDKENAEILKRFGLVKGNYAISVCRVEPENNSNVILSAFENSSLPLVFIGNWPHSDWSNMLKNKYRNCPNIKLLDAIYDLDILYVLRSNAKLYVHGHSAGGTNPSLVEAMHFGMPIAAWDVSYNRETTENNAYYFKSEEELKKLIGRDDLDGSGMMEIAQRRYDWKLVSEQYCKLYLK